MRTLRTWILVFTLASSISAPFAVSGCAAKGVVTTNPTLTETQAVRQLAIRIADETKRAVATARVLRNAAQAMTAPAGPLPAATMDRIDRESITYGTVLRAALLQLESLTSTPSLKATALTIWNATKQFLDLIPATGSLSFLIEVLKATFTLTLEQSGGKA